VIRVISGDHERTALDFQKHYRLDMVHLMDTDLSLQIKHSRGGWPFLMLVDSDGNVVHKANNLVDRETKILKSLQAMKCTVQAAPLKTIDGTSYSTETLYRSGDLASRRARERFSCLAATPDGRLFLVFTSSRDDDSNVWLRIWDGDRWSEDRPVAASAADEYDGTVIVGPDDQAWFCWTSNAGSDKYDVFVTNLSRLDESKDPIRVTRSDDDAMCGRLACDASGVLWITYYKWQKNRAGISRDKEIFVRQFRDGVLSQEVQVSPTDVPSYEDHTDPTIALVGDQALIGWSWDFHRPKGYTQEAREPTIFLRPVESNLMLGQTFHASGHNIDMVPVLAARGDTAWCVWDSLGRTGGSYGKSLFVRRVQAQICAGEPVQIVSNLEHLCSPCFALGSNERNVLVWCQKERDKQWQLMRSDCDPQGHWSGARILVDRVNPRYCSAAFDARDNLWISYTADTEQGRQVKVQRLP
jgi:hypothetical protein